MQLTELIGVRSAPGNRERLEKKLQEFIDEIQKKDSAQAIKVLRWLSIESDLCVHLQHDSKKVESAGSQLGLRLAGELKAFGLVHHSIWVEMQ
jgi:hypothetical protein